METKEREIDDLNEMETLLIMIIELMILIIILASYVVSIKRAIEEQEKESYEA